MRWLPALLFALLLAGPAASQSTADADSVLAEVEAAYERLDYPAAVALAQAALTGYDAYSPDQLVRLHTLLGLVHFARGEELAAAAQFRAALTLDPALELDPLLVSPPTIGFFEQTKATFVQEQATGEEAGGAVRYVRLYDPRPSAFVRSLALPGWGQRFKGQSTKGWVLTGLWVAGVAGATTAELMRLDARERYLAEADPTLVAGRYDDLNRWHWTRNGLLLGLAAVWTYAAVDAGAFGGPERPEQVLAVRLAPDGVALRLTW